jgi:hypothetical protein
MCPTIYVAADLPLAPPYSPEVGGLSVWPVPAAEAVAVRALSKPYVHAVGFQGACGCEFARPGGGPRRALVWLLEWAVRAVPEVELFVCPVDGEGGEPTRRDWASAAELAVWQELGDGTLLVVCGDAGPGNPSRPVAADPTWLTPTVIGLADAIYADRAFDLLPILADALEDAGCNHAEVLAHCRGAGPHVRESWVIDLVLGKE